MMSLVLFNNYSTAHVTQNKKDQMIFMNVKLGYGMRQTRAVAILAFSSES
jgi:hypothetical protein